MRQHIIQSAREAIANNALILDTETTGLGDDDQIVEIAIIDALETFELTALVKPSKPIPRGAVAVHGITDEMVARAMPPLHVWPIIYPLIVGRRVLAYNADFDSRMLRQTFGYFQSAPWSCLMNDWMFFHGLDRWQKLDHVCAQIGVQPGGHRALGDAKAAREVLRWLARQEA